MKKKTPRRLRILALMHESLIPPDDTKGVDLEAAEWKTEYCVVSTLRRLGHEVFPLGVGSNLGVGIGAPRLRVIVSAVLKNRGDPYASRVYRARSYCKLGAKS